MSQSGSPATLARKAAIVGIGATEFSKDSGRSEMQLACEAVKAALPQSQTTHTLSRR